MTDDTFVLAIEAGPTPAIVVELPGSVSTLVRDDSGDTVAVVRDGPPRARAVATVDNLYRQTWQLAASTLPPSVATPQLVKLVQTVLVQAIPTLYVNIVGAETPRIWAQAIAAYQAGLDAFGWKPPGNVVLNLPPESSALPVDFDWQALGDCLAPQARTIDVPPVGVTTVPTRSELVRDGFGQLIGWDGPQGSRRLTFDDRGRLTGEIDS